MSEDSIKEVSCGADNSAASIRDFIFGGQEVTPTLTEHQQVMKRLDDLEEQIRYIKVRM